MSGESAAFTDCRDLDRLGESSPASVASAERESAGEWSDGLEPFGVTAWELPGQGESGARCGEWYPESVCDCCANVEFAGHQCGRRTCPDCWGVWAMEAALRAAERIQQFRYAQPDGWRKQAAHAVVSPPEGEVRTERQYWEGKKKAAEIAESKGWRGFAVVPHPYRPNEEAQERFRAEDPEYGIWVWLREDVEDMARYTKFSPHYHIIGATGGDMEPAEEGDEWTYRFFRSLERFEGVHDRDSHEDVYGLFRYLLSHTGYPEESTKQVVTWYGDMANSVFVEDATEEWQTQKPSEGVRSALRREIEAAVGVGDEDDDGDGRGVEEDEPEWCEVEGCEGEMIDVFDVFDYLIQNDPPPEVRHAMETARDWRLGRCEPPAGMKRPQTEEQAREAFEAML